MRKTVIGSLMAAAFIAGILTACDDNKNNNNRNYCSGSGAGTTINVQGAIAEGGDGGDGGNAANQGGQIAQDGSLALDAEIGVGM